jgi:uncharacterized protein
MKVLSNGQVILSASDMTAASECEWAFVRRLDQRLGHPMVVPSDEDPMRAKAAVLGDVHEDKLLQHYREAYPRQVVEIQRPPTVDSDQRSEESDADGLALRAQETANALDSGAQVIFQATFFDGDFQGFADFLIFNEEGLYEVFDAKLARKAKVTALLQLAAYSHQLHAAGYEVGKHVHLILGDGQRSSHALADIMPVYLKRRAKLHSLVEARRMNFSSGGEPAPWDDPLYEACGSCAVCDEQVQKHKDLLLVAGMRMSQRKKLREAGIHTLEELALHSGFVEGINDGTLHTLRAQAQAQLVSMGLPEGATPYYVVDRPDALDVVPTANAGDIFFDFEGDPLYEEGGLWNLDYLFGLVDAEDTFFGFWAHSIAEEKIALTKFMEYVATKRDAHPDMHIYHYAAYEKTHLLQLARRHGIFEEEVDDLVREHVLVDLYPILRRSIRVGAPSYSLKKIEKIYDPEAHGGDGVTNAADSIVEYNTYRDLVASGSNREAQAKLADLENYNTEDCVSTRKLRDWLLSEQTTPSRSFLVASTDEEEFVDDAEPIEEKLAGMIEGVSVADRSANDTAVALAIAALRYHRRETKSFWWEHFNRLSAPVDTWEDNRGVLVIDSVDVDSDWAPSARSIKRTLTLRGRFAPGSTPRPGDTPFAIYDPPPLELRDSGDPAPRAAHSKMKVLEVFHDGLLVEERVGKAETTWQNLPMASGPATPPLTKDIRARILEWAERIATTLPDIPQDAAFDILRLAPPRGQITHPGDGISPSQAIIESLLSIKSSYLAVQGPPGAGKTHNAAEVIAELAGSRGWKIGVVAQSHATVENLLHSVLKAGLPASQVGKKSRGGDLSEKPWTELSAPGALPGFVGKLGGLVVGGTIWNFASRKSFGDQDLDLLVIDEAGQFSLANTIAASTVARRLLLLGDPQQLPQVSQGTHPEPVNESALGWLSKGHDVLPRELGIFLDKSWRMHEAVCSTVSRLSYDGKLTSRPSDRHLEGVEPGVHSHPVSHRGNSIESTEEADAVVELVKSLLPQQWSEAGRTERLGDRDRSIIVVAPYNAQVNLIAKKLAEAGCEHIPVGTVDKFQGQEAPIAILSLSASSAHEVPRGLDFLLMRNRINVALSRAQWAAYVVYSPALTEFLPKTPQNLALLSSFIEVVEGR